MSKNDDRIGRIERGRGKGRPLILHKLPGETWDQVKAAHVRKHGPIPQNTRVILIGHTFVSGI